MADAPASIRDRRARGRRPRQLPGRTAAQLLLDEALGEGVHRRRQVVFGPEALTRRSGRGRG